MVLGSESATSIAPIEAVAKNPSETFTQLIPELTVRQTPPPVLPM